MSSRHMIISTAGHIDHGKTALVRALTGMETDRLEEEKRRGITIELGFAFLGDDITIIDVPGHERFIKTMVAGVAAVDLALLIVAADEGVMPQTREHLAILHLLGVPRIYVVLTKCGGQIPDWLNLVEDEVRKILPSNYQRSTRFFRCDSISGLGIDELKQALLDLLSQLPPRTDSGVLRLPVDRAFTLKGFGTVVTGTILSGQVRTGDQVAVMPAGFSVRVRGLQSHTETRDQLKAGDRAALNLIGPDVRQIERGDWICQPDASYPLELFDASLQLLPDSPHFKNRERVRLHIGTRDVLGRILLLGSDILRAGQEGFVRVNLEEPIIAARRDRFIIRRYSPLLTLGGGVVLDPYPSPGRRKDARTIVYLGILKSADDAGALEVKILEAGNVGVTMNLARAFLNISPDAFMSLIRGLEAKGIIRSIGAPPVGLLISAVAFNEAKSRMLDRVKFYHGEHPDQLGLARAQLLSELKEEYHPLALEAIIEESLAAELDLEMGYLRHRNHQVSLDAESEKLARSIEAELTAAGRAPLAYGHLMSRLRINDADLNRILGVMILQRRAIRTGEEWVWSAEAIQKMWGIIQKELSGGEPKSASQLREALGLPRRHVIALLEYFDKLGRLQRQEDLRLPGPSFAEPF